MLSKRRNPYWKTPQREANDYIPRQEYILQWMTTMCLLCFFVLLWCFSIFLFQRNVSHAHLIQVCIASVRYISFVSITWSNVEYRKSFQTGQWSIARNLQQFIISLFHCPGTHWYSLGYVSLHFFYNSSLKCGRHGFESRRSWNFFPGFFSEVS